jgi:hypothetical protein
MTEINLFKRHDGSLVGSTEVDQDLLDRWERGAVLRAKVWMPRNIKFHRKYFALLQAIFHNQERHQTIEDLRLELQIRAGHYTHMFTGDGKLIYIPKSIRFSKMSELEFQAFYNKAIQAALFMLPDGWDEEEVDRHVNTVLEFA